MAKVYDKIERQRSMEAGTLGEAGVAKPWWKDTKVQAIAAVGSTIVAATASSAAVISAKGFTDQADAQEIMANATARQAAASAGLATAAQNTAINSQHQAEVGTQPSNVNQPNTGSGNRNGPVTKRSILWTADGHVRLPIRHNKRLVKRGSRRSGRVSRRRSLHRRAESITGQELSKIKTSSTRRFKPECSLRNPHVFDRQANLVTQTGGVPAPDEIMHDTSQDMEPGPVSGNFSPRDTSGLERQSLSDSKPRRRRRYAREWVY